MKTSSKCVISMVGLVESAKVEVTEMFVDELGEDANDSDCIIEVKAKEV